MSPAHEALLPGTVAEIEVSPPGPEVGAFFDLDGTLVAGLTGVMLNPAPVRTESVDVLKVTVVVPPVIGVA